MTCKRNELMVIVSDLQSEYLLISFHNYVAFQGVSAIGAELCRIYEEKDPNLPLTAKPPNKMKKLTI